MNVIPQIEDERSEGINFFDKVGKKIQTIFKFEADSIIKDYDKNKRVSKN